MLAVDERATFKFYFCHIVAIWPQEDNLTSFPQILIYKNKDNKSYFIGLYENSMHVDYVIITEVSTRV